MNFDQASGDRRSWKGVQLDYDVIMSMSDRKCSYCLTEQQVTAILGFCDMFAWPTRWFSDTGDINRQIVADFTAALERNLMGGCCDDNMPIQYRYAADGTLEWSLNGGGNWTPTPQFDSRVYSVTFPPIVGDDGDDKKCIAASGAAALVKEQVGDQLTDDMSRYTLGQTIADWVGTLLQSSNPFDALITVITNQVFALVIAVLRPALTDDVYDQFKCILYCDMEDDASFTEAGWQKVRADILDQIAGIAGLFFEHLAYLLGSKGLTNLSRSGAATEGDCSDCMCNPCSADGWVWPEGSVPEGGDVVKTDTTYEADATGIFGGYYWRFWSASGECCDITVTGDFDPTTTAFCAKVTCENWTPDVYDSEAQPPWTNDALAAPHGVMTAIQIRASYPFRAKATFNP
jgi:hypothetical protein